MPRVCSGVDGNSVDLCQTRSKKSTLRACPPTPLDRSCIHLLGPRAQDPPENANEDRVVFRRKKERKSKEKEMAKETARVSRCGGRMGGVELDRAQNFIASLACSLTH